MFVLRYVLLLIVFLPVGLVSGCGKGSSSEQTADRMRKLLNPLTDYVEETQKSGKPANDEGFKKFLAALSKEKLTELGIANPDVLFVSPRDQKPFVINYDIPVTGGTMPAIWEQSGKDGKRFTLSLDAKVEEIDEESFKKLEPKSQK